MLQVKLSDRQIYSTSTSTARHTLQMKLNIFTIININNVQGVFLHWASPKKLEYGKPRLGESTST